MATIPDAVAAAINRQTGLHAAIESLKGEGRRLEMLDPKVTPEIEALAPDSALIDPERLIDPEELVRQLVSEEESRPIARRFAGLAILALGLALLAITWRWTSLREWLDFKSLIAFAQRLDDLPFAPVIVIGAYIVASLLMVPVSVLVAVSGVVFGAVSGGFYALTGTLLSAAIGHTLGRRLGRDTVRRLAGKRINRLSKRIAARGIVAIVIVRVLPLAPFSVINIVAGASHIGLRDFLLGTFIGLTPGILLTVTFVHHFIEVMRRPTPAAFAVLALVAGILIGIAVVAQRYIGSKEQNSTDAYRA